jgi:uncharacterized protein YqeY
MGMKERISEDLKTAMKRGDKIRLETLRSLRAALIEKEIERRGSGQPVTADEELGVLTNQAKRRKESIEQFEKGGRMELVAQEKQELAVIQEYLPQQLSADDIAKLIRDVVSQTGASSAADFGKVMPLVMRQVKGKADGKVVQELVTLALGGA